MRILGPLHLPVGREEYINGVLGVFHLCSYQVKLLIQETHAPNRGGFLHPSRLLTDVQKDLLTSLPLPLPEREAIIAAHLAYAQAYLPRARHIAGRLGVEWPKPLKLPLGRNFKSHGQSRVLIDGRSAGLIAA